MSELLATIQDTFNFVGSDTGIEKEILREQTFCRVIRKNIPACEAMKILVPYSPDLAYPLPAEKDDLEFVYLNARRQRMRRKFIGQEDGRHLISFLDDNLRAYRAKPDFDLVFYVLPQVEAEINRLHEDLCYCRMLLKPGGQLFLYVENHNKGSLMERLGLQRGMGSAILSRAGLNNIAERRLGHGQILCSGQRPLYAF